MPACHDTPEKAPSGLTKGYGDKNGFYWKEGEVIAVQFVKVLTDAPLERADKVFWRLMMTLGLVTTATVLSVGAAQVLMVIRPVLRSPRGRRRSAGVTSPLASCRAVAAPWK